MQTLAGIRVTAVAFGTDEQSVPLTRVCIKHADTFDIASGRVIQPGHTTLYLNTEQLETLVDTLVHALDKVKPITLTEQDAVIEAVDKAA